MQLIETYPQSGDDPQVAEVDGRTFALPCLVEDDHGVRLLLTFIADDAVVLRVPVHVWAAAHAAGAAALVDSRTNRWMLAETFIAGRAEHPASASYLAPDDWSAPQDTLPTSYVQMRSRAAQRAATQATEAVADPAGFVHLHLHSEASPMDGLSTVTEIVAQAVRHGQHAVAVTDHGVCASHPHLQIAAAKAGIKPIFGIESNFVEDRFLRGDPEFAKMPEDPRNSRKILGDYRHLVLWAMDDAGLRNLWAMSTEANLDGFYGRPRMDWDTLVKHNAGVMASTACLRGPLAQALLAGDEIGARSTLARLMEIFGDRLYVEIHTNQLPDQIRLNHLLVALAAEYDLPLIAAVDSHYPCKEDAETHRVWLAAQTNTDLTDDTGLFTGAQDYSIMSETEVREALAYLGPEVVDLAIANTAVVAARCTAVVAGKTSTPVYSKVGGEQRDVERRVDLCLSNWDAKVVGKARPEAEYAARFEREMKLLVEKKFCGYFLIVSDYCTAAKAGRIGGKPIITGPGRGSGGGSLVGFLSSITDIDPVDADLLFERFMTDGRVGLPDFDVDFPASGREPLMGYLAEKYGEDHILKVGTHIRLQNKGVVRDLARVLKNTIDIHYPDIDAVCKIIEAAEADSAGLGMAWEDLWAQHGDLLGPYRVKYPVLFHHADKMVGRLKAYGQHPSGVIISTDTALVGSLPMRMAGTSKADRKAVAEFDLDALEALGYVKFDLLTLRNLDSIQVAVDLIHDTHSTDIDVYDWTQEYLDPQVWGEISDGHTLGIFQIETSTGTRMAKRFRPQSLQDLADVMTLVRPGPMRSGLTETYLRRKEGLEEITYADPRMEPILAKSLGCMLYQEDIMAVCMVLAGYDSNEADTVRKILGKKQVEKVAAAGLKFVAAAVKNGMQREVSEHLWEQMSEFAKYCVSGDTLVHLAASGRYSDGTVTVSELHRRINAPLLPATRRGARPYAGPCVVCGATAGQGFTRGACGRCYVWRQKFRAPDRGTYGLTVEADGRIRPCRILDVIAQGDAQTFTVTLADGKHLTATADHKHLTPDGLRRVDELAVGDLLITDAGYEIRTYEPTDARTTVGERRGVGTVNGAFGSDNYGYIDGGFAALEAWTAQAPDHCEDCGVSASTHLMERAHLDGNHANSHDWSNLRMLCLSCHRKHDYAYNGRQRRWGKGHPISAVQIVSIEARAVEPVYSVVMDDPHLWIANGIATSNSFGKAHAYGYAVLGHWTGWLKIHYPAQFLTAWLSTVDKARIPEFVTEARRMGYAVRPPDVNLSGVGFATDGVHVRYGLNSVKGIGDSGVKAVMAGQPYTSFADFMDRKGSGANAGVIKTLAAVGAFDSLEPDRKALERRIDFATSGEADRCLHQNDSALGPGGLPCTFDWATEVDPPMVSKGRGKDKVVTAKPPPKRCTRSCRNFTAPLLSASTDVAYTAKEIRDREMDLLGIHLSSTPFDVIPAEILANECADAEQIDQGPSGAYLAAVTISRVKAHTTKTGKPMGFLTMLAQTGEIDVTVFTEEWHRLADLLKPGVLGFAYLNKNDRGITLTDLLPI